MMPIGGFFEIELPRGEGPFHQVADLSCGRACLRMILETLSPRHVYIPFYICDAVLTTIEEAGVPWTCYAVDRNLDPVESVCTPGDVFLYVNFFGLKGATARALARRMGRSLIVDDTQAFFARGYPGSWSFNSARKFFGVPDGAYLYSPEPIPGAQQRNEAPPFGHLIARLDGQQDAAYRMYRESEAALTSDRRRMSTAAERILASIDYAATATARRQNFASYHAALGHCNLLSLPLSPDDVPLCYPFRPARCVRREDLYSQGIYPPMYWLECLNRAGDGFFFERDLAGSLLPLPVDQRYGPEHVACVTRAVHDLLR